jgi:malonyl CoA-acyl carrier protein transacylase
VAAGAISFEDGVRLVKLRGESMQAAADAKPSGMVSVIGLSADKVGGGVLECVARRLPPLPSLPAGLLPGTAC